MNSFNKKEKYKMSLPGIEPGTLSVWNSRDNHYTTETAEINYQKLYTHFSSSKSG